MSAVYRAPIFFATSLKGGWHAGLAAMATETAFRVITSGFYGAFTQAVRTLQPAWLSAGIILVAAPMAVQSLEFLTHRVSNTANLKIGILISTALTGIASLFNWYAMRRGAILTGRESQPFSEDLKRLPGLILAFLWSIPKLVIRKNEKG